MTNLDRVEQACRALTDTGQPITFPAVADHAGLSRATLYRNQQLRTVIDEHRLRHDEARTLTGLTAEIAHLRTAVEAIADLARRQDERIRRLERRNRQTG